MTATMVEHGSEWARRQEWHNGRFAEIDRPTGEILSEHRHTPFVRDPYHERAEETEVSAARDRGRYIEHRDGRWYEIDSRSGEICRRLYTPAEKDLAVRLVNEQRQASQVARFMDIPYDTLRQWLKRDRDSWSASGNFAVAV